MWRYTIDFSDVDTDDSTESEWFEPQTSHTVSLFFRTQRSVDTELIIIVSRKTSRVGWTPGLLRVLR